MRSLERRLTRLEQTAGRRDSAQQGPYVKDPDTFDWAGFTRSCWVYHAAAEHGFDFAELRTECAEMAATIRGLS